MVRLSGLLACTGLVASIAMPAWANLPPAVDRVPADALMYVSFKNLGQVETSIKSLAERFGAPEDQIDLGGIENFFAHGGVNRDGSAAIVLLPGEVPEGQEPPFVVIVPINDYQAFLKAGNAQPGAGVQTLTIEDQELFSKDLGGGFAAIGGTKEVIEAFKGQPGSLAAHQTLAGKVGLAVSDSSNILVVANIPALAPQLQDGIEQMKEQMAEAAAMTGQNMAANEAVLNALAEGFTRDGQAGILGLNVSDAGFTIDLAAQFKDGSEVAGFFKDGGNANALMNRLPNRAFLFAMAIDSSIPGIRQIVKNATDLMQKADPEAANAASAFDINRFLNTGDGVAMTMGPSAGGLMGGGLLLNTVGYIATKDPAGLAKDYQAAYADLNGKQINGITYQTSWKSNSLQVAGVNVDEWSMGMQYDPNSEMAQQMQMANMMMFGPTGRMTGLMAPADGGVVMTMSRNQAMLSEALSAAKAGKGLGSDPSVQSVVGSLPQGRTAEVYIGVKSILDMVLPMAAMFLGPIQVDVPAEMPPIALGVATGNGGMRSTIIVPDAVLNTLSEMAQSLQAQMDQGAEMPEEDAPGAGQPRF